MELPRLNENSTSRNTVDVFLGYNHNLRIGDGQFYDMKNMTSDHYPILAPRGIRGVYADSGAAEGLISKDGLCYVDGSAVVVDGEKINMGLSTESKDCPKSLVSMGAYVIIMPDKKYINTLDTSDNGSIEEEYTAEGDVKFTLCNITGDGYENIEVADKAPTASDGKLWIDTSSTPHTLKKYSSANAMWVSISTTYVKISATGIGENFSEYDGVTLSGIISESVAHLNGSTVIWARSDDYIIVTGIIDAVATQTAEEGKISVARRMPNMDFIIESGNRLWGCRYGKSIDGETVNEIYASKLGDFKNWNCFMNLSTDSYAASCGTDGYFTGAITHLGYPLFFKEGYLHKVYGSLPSNFQIQATALRGVQKGSHRSLAIVGETLFYKSGSAVCGYDGSLPVEISASLGEVHYSDAVAGAHGNKYYISMKSDDGQYHLFVYDLAKGMWHKEDNLHAECFASSKNELYCIEHGTKRILTMLGSGQKESAELEWMAETGIIGMSTPDMKYISRLNVRMLLEVGATVFISIQYDSIGEFCQVGYMTSSNLRSFTIPIRPRRCDHFRVRIEGNGDARIFSITKTLEEGGEAL